MDRYFNNILDRQYYNKEGSRKKNAIYCQQIDRFILVDDYDFWITLKSAQVLSSKIATTVYQLPHDIGGMDNNNCTSYSIFDKTAFKRRNVADIIQNQTPTLKRLRTENIVKADVPEDYKHEEGLEQLKILKDYVNFVNKIVYATEFANAKNSLDNRLMANMFYSKEWNNTISSYEDKTSSGTSLFSDINTILYFASGIKDAKKKIRAAFENAFDNKTVTYDRSEAFYDMINEVNPFKYRAPTNLLKANKI